MEIVKACNAEKLLLIIKKVVQPGSTIYSDKWLAYMNVERTLSFTHIWSNILFLLLTAEVVFILKLLIATGRSINTS